MTCSISSPWPDPAVTVGKVDPGVAPGWFTAAVAQQPEHATVELDGVRITYRAWGPVGRPGIVLIHGGAAHAGWWDHIAPLLAGQARVVALDLSGHGDSDRRPGYSLTAWAAEVGAVTAASGIAGRPVVIGHSMGGWVALTFAVEHAEELAGVVIIDSPVAVASPEEEAARSQSAFGPLRVYATAEQARARYRTVPDQANSLEYVIDHVAAQSLRPVEGGYTWKFDPAVFSRPADLHELLGRVTGRAALFRSEFGLIPPDIGLQMYEMLGQVAPVIEIPAAGHHPMLDQPLALVTGLRTLLADWRHSAPYQRSR
jgi:pimeloyl-ACP methyl ester carboxylesterase